jgi:transcriptional regulator with XRE-family HTH domain
MVKTLYHNDFYGPGLKERRKRIGKTQQEVADEVGIPQSQVSKYENGMIPGADVAVDLYKATRDVYRDTPVEVDELYGEGLKRHREEALMSQQDLENMSGVNRAQISRYEAGVMPNIRAAVMMYNQCENVVQANSKHGIKDPKDCWAKRFKG